MKDHGTMSQNTNGKKHTSQLSSSNGDNMHASELAENNSSIGSNNNEDDITNKFMETSLGEDIEEVSSKEDIIEDPCQVSQEKYNPDFGEASNTVITNQSKTAETEISDQIMSEVPDQITSEVSDNFKDEKTIHEGFP